MTRHGKNATASAVYSYSERRKDAKESGYGTLHQRLGADSIKDFDCCSITLQPCKDPLISPHGFVFDRESVLEYYLQQKKENARKLKEWEKQCKKEQDEFEENERKDKEEMLKKFTDIEGSLLNSSWKKPEKNQTPTTSAGATPSAPKNKRRKPNDDRIDSKRMKQEEGLSNVAGEKANENPSFWIPQLNPTAEMKIEKPDQRVLCPMSGKPLKIKELMSVKFTPISSDGNLAGKKIRYMCPITHDILTNITRCAYLKTSQCVVTMECVEKVIKKDMIDPISGRKLCESDIIELMRGGTGFASTNELKAKLIRPQLELQ